MKLVLGLILSVCMTAPAMATSIYGGPYLVKTVGNPNRDLSWTTCTIMPGMVTIAEHENGYVDYKHQKSNIRMEKLAKLIRMSESEPTSIALHFREQIPNIEVKAGIFSEQLEVVLVQSASRTEMRQGPASDELRDIVENACAEM